MDSARAERIYEELVGNCVGPWRITGLLGCGKSAVVLRANHAEIAAAVKVFDPDLVELHGRNAQLERIARELRLVGVEHRSLVRILDGGQCSRTGYLFVVMELIDAPSLASQLAVIPRDRIPNIISDIAAAAEFLEHLGLAHRDIKPENIAIARDFSRAVLLDLGVLRPFGPSEITDEKAPVFVGTLRYSPPELLMRTEGATIEDWRAISFYQLGAVLHDLITRRPLFEEFSEPYAVLAEAVKTERVRIEAEDVPPELILLAENCLAKRPDVRLQLVTWDAFRTENISGRPNGVAKERVRMRALLERAEQPSAIAVSQMSRSSVVRVVTDHIEDIIRMDFSGNEALPPIMLFRSVDEPIRVSLSFASSSRHRLSTNLCIALDCELVDDAPITVSVTASACLAPDAVEAGVPPTKIDLFKGALDSQALTTRVQEFIWQAIDVAQRRPLTTVLSGSVDWLELSNTLEDTQ